VTHHDDEDDKMHSTSKIRTGAGVEPPKPIKAMSACDKYGMTMITELMMGISVEIIVESVDGGILNLKAASVLTHLENILKSSFCTHSP